MPTDPCPCCGRPPCRPVTADAVVIRDGRVLLIQRRNEPFAGAYALPGGFVDPDETPAACALRELREECGLEGTIEALIGVYAEATRDPARHTVTVAYRVRTAEDAAARAGDDAASILWAPLDNLPPLAFDHAAILADVRAGARLVRLSG
ncbi:MAG: NUDIX hydrolase [Chloroflexota bacterium]|nr:NUDIX hydrolase [Dehalococcoidia bacterium]MDW8252747.1 NUDIX hydrolase [Chloroflexota bacterium]